MEGGTPDITAFVEALSGQHWPLAIAFGLTIMVWILRNFVKDRVPTKIIPFIVLGIAVVSAVGAKMIEVITTGSGPWWQGLIVGLIDGFSVGLPAMGYWSVGLKKLPIRTSDPIPK